MRYFYPLQQLRVEKMELESNLTLAQNDQHDSRLTGLEASVSAVSSPRVQYYNQLELGLHKVLSILYRKLHGYIKYSHRRASAWMFF